jgi:hypothetical protein
VYARGYDCKYAVLRRGRANCLGEGDIWVIYYKDMAIYIKFSPFLEGLSTYIEYLSEG